MPLKRLHNADGQEIDRLREARRLTWEALARRAGLDLKTLKRVISGKKAYLKTLDAIATVLGVHWQDLERSEPEPDILKMSAATHDITLQLVAGYTGSAADAFEIAHHLAKEAAAKGAAPQISLRRISSSFAVATHASYAESVILVHLHAHIEGRDMWCVLKTTRARAAEIEAFLSDPKHDIFDASKYGVIIAAGKGFISGAVLEELAGMFGTPTTLDEFKPIFNSAPPLG